MTWIISALVAIGVFLVAFIIISYRDKLWILFVIGGLVISTFMWHHIMFG